MFKLFAVLLVLRLEFALCDTTTTITTTTSTPVPAFPVLKEKTPNSHGETHENKASRKQHIQRLDGKSYYGVLVHGPNDKLRRGGFSKNPNDNMGHFLGEMRGGERKEFGLFDRYNKEQQHSFRPRVYEGEEELIKDTHEGAVCDIRCDESEFFCVQSCVCLHRSLRCDGKLDCTQYGEDEKGCDELNDQILKNLKTSCEGPDRVLCPSTFVCISNKFLCDGDDDCGDFSDETRCAGHLNCTKTQFECENGLCIPAEWVCDGDNDCGGLDFSDENNCTHACGADEFRCEGDGSCVSESFHCDGEPDCPDASDEIMCDDRMARCPEGEFKCRGSVGGVGGPGGRCILMRYRCDSDNDCGDWSDEENCPLKQIMCASNEFKCDDGRCISMRWKCDSENDCDSGEDEKDCPKEDLIRPPTCKQEEFQCRDGKCILKTWQCDGILDCKRGEDENNCNITCEVGEFKCPPTNNTLTSPTICVKQKHICDRQNDCPNGEDEVDCPMITPCPARAPCEHFCAMKGKFDVCECKLGYILHENKKECVDINECDFQVPVCSQSCTNTNGSFTCGCYEGYVLRPDLRTCKALGGSVKLIMANRHDIRQVSLSNNRYIPLVKGLPNAISIDYHYNQGLLFWSDVSTDVIKRAYINGTMVRDVIKWGLESPGGIAVDWIHDLLFWTDSGTRRVEVSNLDGTLRAVIAAGDIDKPRAIVVHPNHALVFFTDWGPTPKIERMYMDGQGREIITNEGIFWPNGLALDYMADRLFWADAKHHIIESSDLDGRNRRKVMSSNLPHPFALTIFEDSMFWTDWNTKSASTANKITGKGYRHVHDELHYPMDIHAYHPSRQKTYRNQCIDKGGIHRTGRPTTCSHLCLPTKNGGRRCVCPLGLTLRSDLKTCTTEPDKLLLVARRKEIRIRQLGAKDKAIDMVIPLDNIKNIVSLDWSSDNGVIYWGDVGRNTICKASLNGSGEEVIISSNLHSPAGLALDWVTDKLYFTDAGTNRIEVVTTDGKYRSLLVWEKIKKPRDIVVSPIDGLMFWGDWGEVAHIEVAGMDGRGRKSIVSENVNFPNGLAIDREKSKLYFVDAGTKKLEYVNFDGTGRMVLIADGLVHPFGLDFHDNIIYYTDWDTQVVQSIDTTTLATSKYPSPKNEKRQTIIANLTDLMDVRIYHRNRKRIPNPCAIDNGGCSHMCLLKPKGHSCACPVGVLPATPDGRVCKKGPSKYVIFARRMDIRRISLDISHHVDVVLPLPALSNVLTLDVDRKTGELYYADSEEDTITRATMDGRFLRPVLSESIGTIDGLVIDAVGRKIYWTDGERRCIEVAELDGTNRGVLVYEDVDSPRGVGIDYEFGYMFWTDWGSQTGQPRIERAEMDGEDRIKLVTTDIGWPNGLAVDMEAKQLYWADAKLVKITRCDYEGNNRMTMAKELRHPYGLAVSGRDQLFFSDWNSSAIAFVNSTSKPINVTIDLEGIMDLKVVQTGPLGLTNICAAKGMVNGGCSHLCLRKPKSYSCKCPTGITLKNDSKTTCEHQPKAYLLIALRSGIGRISLDTHDQYDVVLPIDGVHGAVVLDFHYKRSKIFYADVNIDEIRSVNMLNTSDAATIVSTGLRTTNGLAVDWIADNIYWSDSQKKVIEVARLDGSSRKRLIYKNLDDPRSLILVPKMAYIFWADWGATPRIDRALMNGQERKTIINSDIGFPTGLAIDFAAKMLYWADALQDRIERCDFDGKNRMPVISPATHPFGFTMYGHDFYWTNWFNKSVLRAHKHNNLNYIQAEEVRHGLRGAMDIRAVASERQPYEDNPCAHQNGDCTHLCLIGRHSYSCECPDVPENRQCNAKTIAMQVIGNDGGPSLDDKWPPKSSRPPNDDSSRLAKAFVTATTVLGIILFFVVVAILALMYSPKRRKNKNSTSGSNRSVLTFANPNYNGQDPLAQPGTNSRNHPKNSSIWRKLKYDKGQERVYEVKCLGPSDAARTSLMPGTPSPTSSSILPLSTIG